MIIDEIGNRHRYAAISSRLNCALDHLATTDFSDKPIGRYELDGKNIFVIVNDYQTKPKEVEPFEVHQTYIDVQYVVSGEENIGYLPLSEQVPTKPYYAKHDYAEYDYESNKTQAAFIPFKAGMFAILFPEDMHMPGVSDEPQQVRKVVIKVKI